jgi:hypothetical protein
MPTLVERTVAGSGAENYGRGKSLPFRFRNANDHSSVAAQPLVDPRLIAGIVVSSIQHHLHLGISPEGVAEMRIQVALVSCHQNDPLVIAPRGVGPGRAFFPHTDRAEQAQGHLRNAC